MIKVLGLDIAQTTGFSILDDDQLLEFGKLEIAIDEGDIDQKRTQLKLFRKQLRAVIKKYKPDLIVYETVYSGPNPKTTARLNQLRGIALEVPDMQIKVNSDPLNTIRRLVLGEGKSHTKKDVFNWAVKKYKLTELIFSKDNDITDSILLSFWGYIRYGNIKKEKGRRSIKKS